VRLVVTGATGGIGSAVVRLFRERGDDVVAVARPSSSLEELCRETGATGAPLDLLAPEPLPAGLTALTRVDALIHAAGISEVAAVAETSFDLWQRTLTSNVSGPAALTRALLPALRAARGRVVFINAVARLHAVPRWAAYAGSKAALTELADSLREEEAPHGVRVTSIYPGGIATEHLRGGARRLRPGVRPGPVRLARQPRRGDRVGARRPAGRRHHRPGADTTPALSSVTAGLP
jgi:NAD(P)-dependent dehydrogenase (short-subunit alcohol dehydrogenase family)